jgi:hypothetical protein
MKNVRLLGVLALLALALMIPGETADATTITIDGLPGDWPTGSPTSLLTTDADEAGITDQAVDVSGVYFTNNTTYLYWRFDTYGTPTRWSDISFTFPRVYICMNTDNNVGTGASITQCGPSGSPMTGVDFLVLLDGTGPSTMTATMRQCTPGCVVVSDPGLTAAANNTTNTTEVRITLSVLGITGPSPSCPGGSPIPSAIYFDNGVTDPDDNIPDSGTLSANIPCPTAVDLTAFTAQAEGAVVALRWATASEYNVVGFHLHRGSSEDRAAATRITSEVIPATGGGASGANYEWTDSAAQAGVAYSYWLEVVNATGEAEEYGPVTIPPLNASVQPQVFLPLLSR